MTVDWMDAAGKSEGSRLLAQLRADEEQLARQVARWRTAGRGDSLVVRAESAASDGYFAAPSPPVTDDRVRRRPIVCGGCGAPVDPLAERCVFCKAWLEVRR